MSFLDLAGPDESTEAKPAKKKSFLDLAGGAPKRTPATFDTTPEKAASMRADILKSGDQQLLAEFDAKFPAVASAPIPGESGAGRGRMPASAYARPPEVRTGAAAIPTQQEDNGAPYLAPAPPPAPPSLAQRVIGGQEAALTTATGMTSGMAGGLAGAAKNIATGKSPEQGFNEGAAQFTYRPRTASGQEQAENVGQAMATHGPAMFAIGPELAVASRVISGGKPYLAGKVDRSVSAMQEAFAAKKGAPRVEPTAEPAAKPHYRVVDGKITEVEPRAVEPGAEPPRPAYVPSLKDTSPEFQQQLAKIKGPHDDAVVSRHIEADTLPIPVRLTKGQATQDPATLSHEQNMRGKQKDLADRFNLQGKQLVQNVEAIRDAAAPEVRGSNHVENGQSLVDSYKSMDEASRADVSAKYKALSDANGGSLPLNGQDFTAAADAALKKQMKVRYVPKEIAADLEGFRQGGPMTFEDFENLRTNLAAEARKAERAGDGNAAGAINIVRSTLEDLPMTGETAQIKPLADAARKAAKTRFDKIKADPAYKAAINDPAPIGEQSAAADNFVANFVVKGKAANVAKMKAHLAEDPVAQQTMAAGVINYLKNKAGADSVTGNFSQAGYNRALAEIQPKIDSLFDAKTAQQIQALGNVAKYTQAQPRGSYVNNSNTFVAGLADQTAGAAELAANAAVPGLQVGSRIRGALARRSERKAVADLLRPGAGVTRISDFPK